MACIHWFFVFGGKILFKDFEDSPLNSNLKESGGISETCCNWTRQNVSSMTDEY